MTNNSILGIRCPNPECGHTFKMKKPEKAGIYKITCPNPACGKQFRVNIPEIKLAPPVPPVSDHADREPISLPQEYEAGESYLVVCPHCEQIKMRFTPQQAGGIAITCPRCKGKTILKVKKPTEIIKMTDTILSKGKLQLLRKGWFDKDYPLGIGKHTIGRFDTDLLSDISIKNDTSMSRRSVEIEVKQGEKGYSFKLTVLKATNPVLHNNKPLGEGECISLNYGDCIILGKTKFRFVKA